MATFPTNPAATALVGDEIVPLTQGGVDKRTTAQDIADLAPVGLANPMTTAGDVIVGGVAGAGSRLGVGADGTVLTVVAGAPIWNAPSGIADGDKGDVVVSGSGAVWTLDAAAASTTLGLGTAATTAAADYATAAQGATADTAVQPAGLASYAPLASPALTGTPTVPTATPATNNTQAASTAYVDAAIAAVPGGSGDVVGPASATADAVALYSGTTGKLLKDGETIASIRSIPQNSRSAAYTLVLTDAGGHIYHPSADTTARTWTIPANASVAFPIGSTLTFVNDNAAGIITIAITTDTMRLAGAGTTGSRTLAANGIATAIKMTATSWQINGTGLT